MTDLLINVPNPQDTSAGTLFGGLPTMPRGTPFTWPVCKECSGYLQYLGRIAIPADEKRPDRFALMFLCNNNPGLCEEWDPDAGGNYVLIVPARNSEPLKTAPADSAFRKPLYGASIVSVYEPDYDLARAAWAESNSVSPRQVVGLFRGNPGWIQSEFFPTCSACNEPTQFLAQVEEGPENATSMNFGGGSAYIYECDCGNNVGKFHTQCG